MNKILISLLLYLVQGSCVLAQSDTYQLKKQEKLKEVSPFAKIINRELPATIEFEDDDLIVFVPLRRQAPVHLLIVPKKWYQPSMN